MNDKKNNKHILYAVVIGTLVLIIGAIFVNKGSKVGNEMVSEESENIQNIQKSPQGKEMGKAPEMDYAAIAQKLGLTEDAVKSALSMESGKRLDMKEVATTLGVTEEELRSAMDIPEMGTKPEGNSGPTPMPKDTNNSETE